MTAILMGWLIPWAISAVAIWLTAKFLPGFEVNGLWGAFWVAALVGFLNVVVGKVLYLVVGVMSLGVGFLLGWITKLIITAIVLKIASGISKNLYIRGFLPAIFGAAIIGFLTQVGEHLVAPHAASASAAPATSHEAPHGGHGRR